MISQALFNTSVQKTNKLLKNNNILKSYNKNVVHDKITLSQIRQNTYFELYQKIVDNLLYTFALNNESILQFDFIKNSHNTKLRYSFYQSPYDFPSYQDWLLKEDIDIAEVENDLLDIYEQALAEANMKKSIMYIRYDYSSENYKTAIHPTSHFHIGLTNSVRIPIDKVVTPLLFTLFIIKQTMYASWKDLMDVTSFIDNFKVGKNSCNSLDSTHFTNLDKKELYLT